MDDSFFVIEQLGIMSQYFLASSVGHPLMRQMLETGLYNLKQTNNVMVNHAATTTGPKAVKVGFIKFMAEVGVKWLKLSFVYWRWSRKESCFF